MTEKGVHTLVHRSLGPRVAIFLLVLASLCAAVAPVALYLNGAEGLLAAGVALAICVVSGGLALVINEFLQSPELVLYQVLVGMAIRSGIPLVMCLVIYAQGGPLVDAGMVFYLLVFYFVTLLVETVLTVTAQQNSAWGR